MDTIFGAVRTGIPFISTPLAETPPWLRAAGRKVWTEPRQAVPGSTASSSESPGIGRIPSGSAPVPLRGVRAVLGLPRNSIKRDRPRPRNVFFAIPFEILRLPPSDRCGLSLMTPRTMQEIYISTVLSRSARNLHGPSNGRQKCSPVSWMTREVRDRLTFRTMLQRGLQLPGQHHADDHEEDQEGHAARVIAMSPSPGPSRGGHIHVRSTLC